MSTQLACTAFATQADVLEASCACDLNEDEHGAIIDEYLDDASDVLYVLSGGRVTGRCTRTVWPYRPFNVCGRGGFGYGFWPNPWGGQWGGGMGHRPVESWVDYDSIDSIPLMGPDTDVSEVTIDGLALDPSEYGLIDGYKLFRRSGFWPSSNDLTKTDADAGTFTVTYSFGRVPNLMIKRAIIELVCQMIHSDSRALSRLRGIVSANVQGVSVQMSDEAVDALGLPELSRFMDVYGGRGVGALGVYAPELNHGWRLISVSAGSTAS